MKSDELRNYRRSLLMHRNMYEEAHQKFHQELQAVLNKKQIQERTFFVMSYDYLDYIFGVKLPDIIIGFIENYMNEHPDEFSPGSGKEFRADMFQKVGLFEINLETETIERYPIDEVKSFLDRLFGEVLAEKNRVTEEKYELNKLIYKSNSFINWIKKREKRVNELSQYYTKLNEALNEIQEARIMFTERITNNIIKTAKDEFEAVFGVGLILSSKKPYIEEK